MFLYFEKGKPRKNSLYLRKWNFLIFQKTENLKTCYISESKTFRARKVKKSHSEKISSVSGNGTFYSQA